MLYPIFCRTFALLIGKLQMNSHNLVLWLFCFLESAPVTHQQIFDNSLHFQNLRSIIYYTWLCFVHVLLFQFIQWSLCSFEIHWSLYKSFQSKFIDTYFLHIWMHRFNLMFSNSFCFLNMCVSVLDESVHSDNLYWQPFTEKGFKQFTQVKILGSSLLEASKTADCFTFRSL